MFTKKRILVVGDFMLDLYSIGEVQRISPEAPVPVLRIFEQSHRPGGAGNTLINLISLGMQAIPLGRVGWDDGGDQFIRDLTEEGVDVSFILRDPTFKTPLKNRMIASNQQLMRVDFETPSHLSHDLEKQIVTFLPKLLKQIDIVAISDYAKGFLTCTLLQKLIKEACDLKIPVIVDPKGRDFSRYKGASLIKPNLSEALAAAGLGVEAPLEQVAEKILHQVDIQTLMITRSQEGISIFEKKKMRQDFPARIHEIKDVTGAGDTVLAVVAAALANKMDLSKAAHLANIAAGLAIERIGCARISLDDLTSCLG